jgi:hypothetical protein
MVMMSLDNDELPWQPKPNALPLGVFPSEGTLAGLRNRIPESSEVNGYKVRDMIPTHETILEIQKGIHALTSEDENLSELLRSTFLHNVEKKYGATYSQETDGTPCIQIPDTVSYWEYRDDRDLVQEAIKLVQKYISKDDVNKPLNRLK